MKNVQMGIRHVDTEKLYDTFKNYELYSKYFKYKKQLQDTGLVMVDGETILNNLLLDVNSDDFHKYWDNLEIDKHMSDGGNYRYRRFGCYKYNIEYSCLELLRGKSHFFQSN